MKNILLTIQQAAKILGVNPMTLRRWEEKGILIPLRTEGNQRRYLLEDLQNFKKKKNAKIIASPTETHSVETQAPSIAVVPTPIEALDTPFETVAEIPAEKSDLPVTTAPAEETPLTETPMADTVQLPVIEDRLFVPQQEETPIETAVETPAETPIEEPVSEETVQEEVFVSQVAAPAEPVQESQPAPVQHDHFYADYVAPTEDPKPNVQVSEAKPFTPSFASRMHAFSQNLHTKSPAVMAGLLIASLITAGTIFYAVSQGRDEKTTIAQGSKPETRGVLAAETRAGKSLVGDVLFNIPAVFEGKVTINDKFEVNGESLFTEDITVADKNVDLGTGELTASNVVYSITAGNNITISGDPQNPIISAGEIGEGGVDSFQGQTGAVELVQGSGIGLNGLTITNTGVLSVQGQTGSVTLAGGSGITVSGTTISNTDGGSAQNIFKTVKVGTTDITAGSNTDTLTLTAGTGITLTPNAGGKSITIDASSGTSQWTTTGSDIYYTTGNVGIGTGSPGRTLDVTGTARVTGAVTFSAFGAGILHTDASGVLSSSALNLAGGVTEITGTLPVGNGGTGLTSATVNGVVYGNGAGAFQVTSAPTAGQILMGNGSSVPTFTTLSGGGTLSGTGVLSLNLTQVGETASTSANSGLEFSTTNGLSLLRGCDNGQILKWNDALDLWECSNDSGGATGVINVENNDVAIGASVDTLDFGTDFLLAASPANEANISIADDILNFSEFADSLALDAATSVAVNNFDFTLGTNGGTGKIVIAPNAGGDAALIINKQNTTGDIFTASSSGTTRLTLSNGGDLNLASGAYQIGGTTVLSGTALGTGVTTSSLTQVGALASGSIANGFGSIFTANTIQGSDITASGTTGFSSTGNGAGLTFSGTGNHLISASTGVLQLGAVTLTGAVTGGNQNITGVGNLSAGGSITFGGLTTDGGVLYTNGSGVVGQSATGSPGQVLVSNGGGAPTWVDASGVGTNYWLRSQGTLSPTNATDDLLLGNSATGSAKVAFINIGSGTPTASISANTANNSVYITGTGNLATTNMQTLTLGGNSTGNLLLDSGSGLITLADATVLNSSVTVGGITTLNGQFTLGDNGDIGAINTSDWDITATGDVSGVGSLATDGQFTLGDGGETGAINTSDWDIATNGDMTGIGAITMDGNFSQTGATTFSTGTGTVSLNGNVTVESDNSLTLAGLITNGGVLYTNGSGVVGQTLAGLAGQVLVSNAGGAPTWADAAGVGTNYWQRVLGTVAPVNITDDLLLGSTASNSAKFAFTNVASGVPTASISAGTPNNSLYITGNGTLATTNRQTLTIGSASTGDIVLSGFGAGVVKTNAAGVLSSSAVDLSTTDVTGILPANRGGTGDDTSGTTGVPYISAGNWQYEAQLGSARGGTGADLSAATQGSIPYFSAAGVMSALAPSTAGYVLTTNGAGLNPSWTDASSLGTNYWDRNNGVLSPKIAGVHDLLLGSNATGSAKFAFINVNSGTPTASISAGTGNTATFLTGAGNLSTTNAQTLMLGGTASGNILVDSGTGLITLADDTTFSQNVTIAGATGLSFTGAGSIALTGGTISDATDEVDINDNVAISGILQVGGTGATTYSRLGTGTAGGGNINAADDLLVSGGLEVDDLIYADGGIDTTFNQGSVIFAGLNGVLSQNNGNFFWDDTNARFGLGTTSPLARLDVRGQNATTPGATISAATTFAAAVVDQTGTGDIFTASKSGATKFTILNNGDVRINNLSAANCDLKADASGLLSCGVDNGGVNYWQLTSGTISPFSDTLDVLVGSTSTASAKFAFINVASGTPTASISGTGDNRTFLTGAGNLGTTNAQSLTLGGASTGNIAITPGNGTGRLALNAGSLTINGISGITDGTAQCVTTTNGIVTGTGACQLGSEQWVVQNGSIYTGVQTLDLLLGGTATASAKFAVLNMSGGTPTASISGTGDNRTFLSGSGNLGTTNAQTLMLGGASTGNIVLDSGTGLVSIADDTTFSQNVTIAGATGLTFSSTGGINLAGGTISDATDEVDINDALAVTGVLQVGDATSTTYSRLGTGTAGGANINASDDLFVSGALEVDGVFYVDGTLDTTFNQGSVVFAGLNGVLSQNNGSFFWDDTNARFGLGTTSPLARLDVRGQNATTPAASVSAASNFAAVVVDQSGAGDLFTASKSGATKFAILNNGDVRINNLSAANCDLKADASGLLSCGVDNGGVNYWQLTSGAISPFSDTLDVLVGSTSTASAKFAFMNVASGTPTASISAGTANNNTFLTGTGNLGTTNAQSLTLGGASTGNIAVTPGNGAGRLALNLGSLTVNGLAGITDGSAQCVTTTNGIVTGTGACQLGSEQWVVQNGSIYTGVQTLDLLLGGTATDSAKFAVVNMSGSGTPTASISGTGNNRTFLSGSGNLGTTNAQTLTLGGASTGNIAITPANGTGRLALTVGSLTMNGVAGITDGTPQCVTTTNGIVTGTGACQLGSEQWVVQNGSIYTGVQTLDLLLGGTATASAKFAVLNMSGSGTPTASISGTGDNRTYLSGSGNLGTTNAQTLMLGGASTGNILLDSGTGLISLVDDTTFSQNVTIAGATGLTFSGAGNIALTGGSISDATDEVDINDDLAVSGVLQTGGTGAVAYNRFGTGTAGGATINANDDVLVSGGLEVDGVLYVDGTLDTTFSQGSVVFAGLNGVLSQNNGNFFWDDTNARFGLGTTSPLARLDVRGQNATTPAASVSANSNFAAAVVDQNGTGDIFTASKSGATKFTINNNGNLVATGTLTGLTGLTTSGTVRLSNYTTTNGLLYTNASGDITQQATAGTDGQILVANGAGVPTWVTLGTDATITNTGAITIAANAVRLGQDTTGDFVQRIASGSGILASGTLGEDSVQTISLGDLTADWSQAGAFDVVLNNASSELRILESSGATYFGTIDVGDLSDNRIYTFPDDSGTVCLSIGNCAGGAGGSKWQVNGNVISPLSLDDQVAIGGGTTTDFFLGVSGARTGKALVGLNETGNQDILVASAGGAFRFGVSNNGNLAFTGNTSFVNTITSLADADQIITVPNLGASDTLCFLTLGNCAGAGGGLTGSGTSGQIAFFNGTGTLTSESTGFSWNASLNRLGIGTDTPLSTFDVRGNTAHLPIASVSGTTTAAGMIVDNNGTGDIFTASKSGATKFSILNNGNIQANNYSLQNGVLYGTQNTGVFAQASTGTAGLCLISGASSPQWGSCEGGIDSWTTNDTIGSVYTSNSTMDVLIGSTATTSAKFAFMNVAGGTPTASISGTGDNRTFLSGAGNLGTTNMQSLTLGGSSTGNIVLDSGNGTVRLADLTTNGIVYTSGGNGTLNSESTLSSVRGGTGADLSAATQGSIPYFSATGVMSALAPSTAGYVLSTNGAGQNPTWIEASSLGTNYWDRNNGVLSPKIAGVHDLLLGADATGSAKFAFINVNSGTPTASISGTGDNRTFLSGSGNLGTTNAQTLMLGGASTGNIVLDSGTGLVSIADDTTFSQNVTIAGATGLSFSGAGNIAFTGGSISDATDEVDINDALAVTGVLQVGGNTSTTYSRLGTGTAGGGNIGAADDLFISSALEVDDLIYADGGIDTTFNQGSIVFAGLNGVLSQSNNNFFWDDTNTRLGLGTTTPLARLDVRGQNAITPAASVSATSNFASFVVDQTGTGDIFTASKSGATKFTILNTGDVRINNLSAANCDLKADATGLISCGVDNGGTNYWQLNNGAISPFSNTLDVLVGSTATSSAQFGVIGIASGTPVATMAATTNGNGLVLNAASSTIQSLRNNTLVLGGDTTGNIVLDSGTNAITLADNTTINGTLGVGAITTTGTLIFSGVASDITTAGNEALTLTPNGSGDTLITSDFNSTVSIGSASNTDAVLSVRGGFGSNAALIVDQLNSGDIFAASASGTTRFTIGNSGTITASNYIAQNGVLYGTHNTGVFAQASTGTAGLCLISGASAPVWGSCEGGIDSWTTNNAAGTVNTSNSTMDVLIGGTASDSAKFAFMNVAGGTPTASISGTGDNRTYLTGAGNLGTTNAQTLMLGGAATGNILLDSGSGLISLADNTTFSQNITIAGTTGLTWDPLESTCRHASLSIL